MRRSADFSATVRRGRRGSARLVTVHLAPPGPGADDTAPAQVGFVVSRAVGPAVVRNRVRRRLRHLMRARLAVLPAGARVVVRAQPASSTASSKVLARDLEQALTRAAAGVSKAGS
jgi:ribonuclease P protein component